jgi:hypothetical protein
VADWIEEEDDDDKTISLDDLENLEHKKEHEDDPFYDENNWGESYDDMDSEAWEKQYRIDEDEEVDTDPWELD